MSKQNWHIEKSRELYNISHWSEGYFDINANGELIVLPHQNTQSINLYQLAQSFNSNGLSFPILVRFSNILHHRIESLYQAFTIAMQQENYQANYTPVYPIKVNQQQHVIEEILKAGQGRVGLEAGSKPELMLVLALASMQNGTIICNGYKDQEYIRLALIGQQMGLSPCLVIEKMSELELIIEESQRLNVLPYLGLRIRLASVGKGNWQNTGGEKAKFGLSATQILTVVEQVKQAGLLDCLKLMHFHMGSQISNVRDIQKALKEAAYYYKELHALGVPIQTIDVGGGLGIDYDGTHSRTFCSKNYSIQEYANNIVHEFWNVCHQYDLPHPNIITETGRAMTAHHAVLITNLIDVEYAPDEQLSFVIDKNAPDILQDLWESLHEFTSYSALEAYHDAVYLFSEAQSMFTHGVLNLTQRAQAEQIYFAICWKARSFLQASSKLHREVFDELNDKLIDKYFCNFSLFQSTPDAWAIDQLFPIMPLHRLHEKPTRRGTIQDLTCDSDGQFEYYVEGEGVGTSLLLHEPNVDETYLIGIFLIGAYQETLGDIHNLFGDTYSVNVHLLPNGDYELVDPLEGDTVQSLLGYINIEASDLKSAYRKRLQAANLTSEQKQSYLKELEAGLMGYTYLE